MMRVGPNDIGAYAKMEIFDSIFIHVFVENTLAEGPLPKQNRSWLLCCSLAFRPVRFDFIYYIYQPLGRRRVFCGPIYCLAAAIVNYIQCIRRDAVTGTNLYANEIRKYLCCYLHLAIHT